MYERFVRCPQLTRTGDKRLLDGRMGQGECERGGGDDDDEEEECTTHQAVARAL